MKKSKISLVELLTKNGWAFYQTGYLKDKEGKKHTAFAIETYPQNIEGIKPVKYDELSAAIKANFNHVWEGKTYCQYTPEIKKTWVSVW